MRATIPLAVVAVLLAGCSSGPPEPADAVATVVPGGPDDVPLEGVTVLGGDDSRHLRVVTTGSSSCPVVPTTVRWDARDDVLRIGLSEPGDHPGACTADISPTTFVVRLPDEAPDAPGITVEVDGREVPVD